jgi:exonuclease VII large subunit
MDLETLQRSMALLEQFAEVEDTISIMQKEIDEKDGYIMELERKLDLCSSNSQMKNYVAELEELVKRLKKRIEELEMVRIRQLNSEKWAEEPEKTIQKDAENYEIELETVLNDSKVWETLNPFLSSEDLIKLSKTSENIEKAILSKPGVLKKLLIPQESEPQPPKPKTEIHGLLKR